MSHEHRRVSISRMQVHWGEMARIPLDFQNDRHDGINRDRPRREPMQLHERQVFQLEELRPIGFSRRLPGFILSDPLFGEAFCTCYRDKGHELPCVCGENDSVFDWVWDNEFKTTATQLQNENREVRFHTDYSCGTAAVRGNRPMLGNQYFWEIKMTTPVYGTDMMVGVGTSDADLNRGRNSFCSLLGSDCESWGLSYTGLFYHQGKAQCYAPRFGQGSIIGIHLDMWNGTLSFYKNRLSLGVACRGLKGKTLYPMVSSTAARSGMKVIRSQSFNSSLQYLCCLKLREIIPSDLDVLDVMSLPPGLALFLQNNLGWLLSPTTVSAAHCCHCRNSKENLQKSTCHSHTPDVCNNSNTCSLRPSNADITQTESDVDSEIGKPALQHAVHTHQAESPSLCSRYSLADQSHCHPSSKEQSDKQQDVLVPVKIVSSSLVNTSVPSGMSIITNFSASSDDAPPPSFHPFGVCTGSSAKRKHSSSSEELNLDDEEETGSDVSMFKRQQNKTL